MARPGRINPSGNPISPPGWPICPFLEAECVAHAAAGRLGNEPLAQLAEFIAAAGVGARLTLQRNRTGFTVQITHAIERSEGAQLDPEGFRDLAQILLNHRPEPKK